MTAVAAGLIGHTGFVGGTLLRAHAFDACFNSANADAMRGRHFQLLICAGVSAVKWQANKDPGADAAGIARLTDALADVTADELVLISTVDVYPDPSGGDEDTAIAPAGNHAYGRHRLALEAWCRARFEVVRVVRLPALFGAGLRKNALFDLMHGRLLEAINPAAVFQWYPMARLCTDLSLVRRAGLGLVNLVPEPVPTRTVLEACFPSAQVGPAREPAPCYAVETRHATLFGGEGRFMMDAGASLAALQAFVVAGV